MLCTSAGVQALAVPPAHHSKKLAYRNMIKPITFILVVVSLLASTAQAQREPEKYAILVAVDDYQQPAMNIPKLEYTVADAKAIGAKLQASGYRVDYLLNEEATREKILQKLNGLRTRSKNAKGIVFVGLFGHGTEIEATSISYYCPYDAKLVSVLNAQGGKGTGKQENDPDTMVSIDAVLAAFTDALASDRVLIADCCRFDRNAVRGRAVGSNLKLSDLPANTNVVLSCSSQQKAYEHSSYQVAGDTFAGHGAFSKCFLEAMSRHSQMGSIVQEVKPAVTALVNTTKSESDPSQTPRALLADIVDLRLKIDSQSTIPPPTAKKETSESLITNTLGMQLKLIPAGEFLMGSTETKADLERMGISLYEGFGMSAEQPQHRVKISRNFYMGVHEVTLNQFLQYYNADKVNHKTDAEKDGKGGSGSDGTNFEQKRSYVAWNTGWNQPVKDYMNHPVVNVSWNDAVSFCEWLTETERAAGRITRQQEYRLPSEAQWEYACRGGSRLSKLFSFGNNGEDFVRNGNVRDAAYAKELGDEYMEPISGNDGYVFSSPVGTFQANGFGLYDMHGNVWEWCEDVYDAKIYGQRSSVTTDPVVFSEGSLRVLRGGGWSDAPVFCRSAYRNGDAPDNRSDFLGFRVSLSSVQ